ncbi:MAG: hypothetical protein HQK62_08735 [Desulfamplus sp.]|nr:hypothetical protein [Desulfamplus sp.]
MKIRRYILYCLTILFLPASFTQTIYSEQSNILNKSDKSALSSPSKKSGSSKSSQHHAESIPSSPAKSRQAVFSEKSGQVYSEKPNYTTVITIGVSPIKKNKLVAKQNATNVALKEAVEKSVIRMMSRVELTLNLNHIYDAVNHHAEKFIISYRIIGELTRKDDAIVALESQIDTDALAHFFYQRGDVNNDVNMQDFSVDEVIIGTVEKASGFNTIKAKIEGSDYLSSFIMLRKTLSSMNGIKDVQTRELTSDQAIVTIVFTGDGKNLANELMLNSFQDFSLELSDITPESLTIRFIPKTNGDLIEGTDMEGAYISE